MLLSGIWMKANLIYLLFHSMIEKNLNRANIFLRKLLRKNIADLYDCYSTCRKEFTSFHSGKQSLKMLLIILKLVHSKCIHDKTSLNIPHQKSSFWTSRKTLPIKHIRERNVINEFDQLSDISIAIFVTFSDK